MPRTPSNLPRHELIGLDVDIVESTDPGKEGISGTVVDETQHTIVVDDGRGTKQIPKQEATFRFHLAVKKVRVQGELLEGRPEDRLDSSLPQHWGTNPA